MPSPNTNWDTAVLQIKPMLAVALTPREDTKTIHPHCPHSSCINSPKAKKPLWQPHTTSCITQSLYMLENYFHPTSGPRHKYRSMHSQHNATLKRSNGRELWSWQHLPSAAQCAMDMSNQGMKTATQCPGVAGPKSPRRPPGLNGSAQC